MKIGGRIMQNKYYLHSMLAGYIWEDSRIRSESDGSVDSGRTRVVTTRQDCHGQPEFNMHEHAWTYHEHTMKMSGTMYITWI